MSTAFPQCEFVKSAAAPSDYPPEGTAEIAFAGRSNAGKSSAINAITGRKALARTSRTPGRTQLINFFSTAAGGMLVDLPGYGYAKAAKSARREWALVIEHYLSRRESLIGVVLIMDIRHPLKPFDLQLLEWCREATMPAHILLTKADKLSRGKGMGALQSVQRSLQKEGFPASIQLFSASAGTGVDEAREVVIDAFAAGLADEPDA